eukprot:gene13359-17918_t
MMPGMIATDGKKKGKRSQSQTNVSSFALNDQNSSGEKLVISNDAHINIVVDDQKSSILKNFLNKKKKQELMLQNINKNSNPFANPAISATTSITDEKSSEVNISRNKKVTNSQNSEKLNIKKQKNSYSSASDVPSRKFSSISIPLVAVEDNIINSNPLPSNTKASPRSESNYLTDELFSSLDISTNTKRALSEVLNYSNMTLVQKESLPSILAGKDVLVKAKTGTGKTLGFLIPAIEILIRERANNAKLGRSADRARGETSHSIIAPRMLILSPTRELAQQISAEAEVLCRFHDMSTVLLVGGTNMASDVRALNRPTGNDIIVGSPGRILAHLKETPGFAKMCEGVKVLIFDEADRLLDMGFKPDIDKITDFLNRRNKALYGNRQTLLFSATVSTEIQSIAKKVLLPGHLFIDTVGEEADQTHSHVPQQSMVVALDQQLRAIIHILEEKKREGDYKIIIFFPTARQTGYYATILNSIGINTLEIHSRISQSKRTRVSDQFRQGKNLILASSDVSARGMDYPDVSFVLQIGTTSKEQYIHRLGRTARAGKEGSGLLLLAPFESKYMLENELSELTIDRIPPPLLSLPATGKALAAERLLEEMAQSTASFGDDNEKDSAEMAWSAWLGFYKGYAKKFHMDSVGIVQMSLNYALSLGLKSLPALPKSTISKMGLAGVPGLIVGPNKRNVNNVKKGPSRNSSPSNGRPKSPENASSGRGYVPRNGNGDQKQNNTPRKDDGRARSPSGAGGSKRYG